MLNPYTFGAVGDGGTDDTYAWRACLMAALAQGNGVTVPRARPTGGPSIFKTSGELCASGIDVLGEGSAINGCAAGPSYPTFLPVAGSRLFKIGPRDTTDVANGFTDRAVLGRLAIDLTAAPAGFVGIGSDYGVSKRHVHDLSVVGLAGQVGVKNFAAFRLDGTNFATEISFYNTFERIHVHHCADAFDLIASQRMRYDDTHFSQCYVWNAHRGFSVIGISCQFDACGVLAFDADFAPDVTPTTGQWAMKLAYGALCNLGGGSNKVNAFSLDNITGIKRPFFYVHHTNVIGPIREMDWLSYPTDQGGAPDYIQVLDNSDHPAGPQYTAGPTIVSDESIRSANIASPQMGFNLVPNGRWVRWAAGGPCRFTAVPNGAPGFALDPQSIVLQSMQSCRVHVPSNPGGVSGLSINLADHYPIKALRHLLKVNVGILCFCTAGQGVLDGVSLEVFDGVNRTTLTGVIRFDGTQSFNSLQQHENEWHCGFVNHELAHAMNQLTITVGMKKDATHAGTGDLYLDALWCVPGTRDAYTARAPLLPPALEALLA